MKPFNKVSLFATLLCVAMSATSCAAQQPSPEPFRSAVIIADADPGGFITYDPGSAQLAGYTSSGLRVWQEKDVAPGEVHCSIKCPDVGFSINNPTESSSAGSEIIWHTGNSRTVTRFSDPTVNLYWTSGPSNWIASDTHGITWERNGNRQKLRIPTGTQGAQGKISSEGRTLAISTALNGTSTTKWISHTIRLNTGHPETPKKVHQELFGPIGCLSDRKKIAITLGSHSQLITIPDGHSLRDQPSFSSDCSINNTEVISGEYGTGPNGPEQRIRVQHLSGSEKSEMATAYGNGRISIYDGCGVYVSRGIISTLTASSKNEPSHIEAQDAIVTSSGTVFAITPSGKPRVMQIGAAPDSCKIRSEFQ
ncbi:hypothetical protein [Streptomyces sp. NPDC056144]|uniref:hypothetical protein n=1 Tax=unclassified Streptomyces TaxID=2593676 RepID=UPI0035E14A55